MEGTASIRRVYDLADEIDREEGLLAYPRYRITLERFAEHYGVPLESVVGAFAALSPNNDYVGNLRSLATLLWGWARQVNVSHLVVSTYGSCKLRAWSCLGGADFLSFTEGKKTRAFYKNIVDPKDPEPVTIDGHMVALWYGKRMTMKEAVRTRFRYDDLADGFRTVAADVALIPCQVQAICWFTWKRMYRVKFNPQLNLFRGADQWGSAVHPRDVRIFPLRSTSLTSFNPQFKPPAAPSPASAGVPALRR